MSAPALSPTAVSDHDPVETVRAFHRERDADLMTAVRWLLEAHPVFRSKPVGAPGSAARAAQESAIAAEDAVRAALARVS